MGYIYYVRHGETTWNVANKVCGQESVLQTVMEMENLPFKFAREFSICWMN